MLCSERKPDWPLFNKHFYSDIDIAGHTYCFLSFYFGVVVYGNGLFGAVGSGRRSR